MILCTLNCKPTFAHPVEISLAYKSIKVIMLDFFAIKYNSTLFLPSLLANNLDFQLSLYVMACSAPVCLHSPFLA